MLRNKHKQQPKGRSRQLLLRIQSDPLCALFFHSPIQYFNLRPGFTIVLLQNNLAWLQLFMIILNGGVRISDRPQQAQDIKAALFDIN